MQNQKGFTTLITMFAALILVMGLASAVSNPKSNKQNNNTNTSIQDSYYILPKQIINSQTPIGMDIQTACSYMGGSWYRNTNTCAGNINTNICTQAGGKINGCDSSCRYAKSRICYPTCEITCTFN